jgi:hypothetical protein
MKTMLKKSTTVPFLPLERWNRRWDLVGTQVQCKTCGAHQDAGQARNAFKHQGNCSDSPIAQYPLRELQGILVDQMDRGLA